MKKLAVAGLVLAGLVLSVLVGGASAAYAQDSTTGGVSQSDANKVCSGILGKNVPSTTNEAAFRAAANTPTGTDDVGFEGKVVPEWQALIVAQETHRDYLGGIGLNDSKTFACRGAVANFPKLELSAKVQKTICANERLDLIANGADKGLVDKALKFLGRSYANARLACTSTPTAPPTSTTTPVAPATTIPATPPATTSPATPRFATCADASAVGVHDIPASSTDYRADLDSDSDGLACELPTAALDGGDQVSVVPNAIDTGRA